MSYLIFSQTSHRKPDVQTVGVMIYELALYKIGLDYRLYGIFLNFLPENILCIASIMNDCK